MNSNTPYWIWLQSALGAGARIKEITEYFGGVKEVYDAGETQWKMSPVLVPRQVEHLKNCSLAQANDILTVCRLNSWQVITPDDENYPRRLYEIDNPPAALYVAGNLPDIDNSVAIGIVGTRKASDYAIKAADVMSRGIAKLGAVVVSGGALGVDTAAHNAAILSFGKTVAVLGCGLGTNYLMENKPLRDSIAANGALVTEFQPFTKASRYTFPVRNRIISGLSLGVLVVEAGIRSGSLITAGYAADQGRDVYAIPCSILEPEYAGTNKLIDQGAVVATKPLDLVYPYAERFGIDVSGAKSVGAIMKETSHKTVNAKETSGISFENLNISREKRAERQKAAAQLSGNTLTVYRALGEDYMHVDEIAAKPHSARVRYSQRSLLWRSPISFRAPEEKDINYPERNKSYMSKLVIVESPAKAKNIKGYLGKGYEVVASMGHVRDLPSARLSVDIEHDFAPKYAIIKGKENFVKELQKKRINQITFILQRTLIEREKQ